MAGKYWEEINSEFGQCADSKAPDTELSWKKKTNLTDRVASHLIFFFLIFCTDELLPFEKYGHIIKDNMHIHMIDK